MARTALKRVIQHVRLLAAVQTGRALSDADLLARFIEQNDEAAFTVLVERHAPMILGVCQRALRHSQDAEDACQATFLVLARKAGSIRKTAALGSWLHGIACRVCANLKRQRARRAKRERGAVPVAPCENGNCQGEGWPEIQAILDEELQSLPERYREALLLCYWQGKTRDEAAERLGLTIGKLHGLLERGRTQLRARLTGRGLTLSAALCATFLTAGVGHTAPAPTMVVTCTKGALLLSAGEPLAPGIIPEQVLTLTKEVLRTMFITKLKIVSAFIVCAGLMATLIGGSLPMQGLAQDQPAKPRVVIPAAPKNESDEAFIRRISKDLRGTEPSPAEVHFFVSSSDAGKRQKLIDLFIQERQARQQAKKDVQHLHGILRLDGVKLIMVEKANPSVIALQSKFFSSLTAAKDKKDVAASAHNYLDALTKHIKEHPKAADVPDAMLQMELVYRSLGKTVEANAWGERLKKEYPNSPAARQRQSSRESGIMMLELRTK